MWWSGVAYTGYCRDCEKFTAYDMAIQQIQAGLKMEPE